MASLVLYVVFVIMLSSKIEGQIGLISKEEDLEIEQQLRVLNKPPIISFRSKDGSIIDCIDIYKQPAFDHPLLRNHTIQLRPSFGRRERLAVKSGPSKTSVREGVECPPGTVPIRRTTKEDLVRAKSLSRPIPPSAHSFAINNTGHHFATFRNTYNQSNKFDGLTASVSIYNENVYPKQFSGAGGWVINNLQSGTEAIHYGYIVNPELYGDTKTRTFSFWMANNGNSGCYDVRCPGFVQVSPKSYLGFEIVNQSTYGGLQYFLQFQVRQDESGNWWLEIHDGADQVRVGYWPKSLFKGLGEFASDVQFGGQVYDPANDLLPTMGSGSFEPPQFSKTGFVSNIEVHVKNENSPREPDLEGYADFPACYQAKFLGNTGNPYQLAIMYGGPNPSPACHK